MKPKTAIEKAEMEEKENHDKWFNNPSPYLFEKWQKSARKVDELKLKLKGIQTELQWQNQSK